jgi:hypothetical protein
MDRSELIAAIDHRRETIAASTTHASARMAWLRLGELREVVEAAEADSPLLVEVARELSKTREVQIDVDSLIRLARGR